MEEFSRNLIVIGSDKQLQLATKNVLLVGVGGVGGYVLESLVRVGITNITIVDNDEVTLSNINRQIIALHSTIGMKKVDVAIKRALDINPNINIKGYDVFYDNNTYQIFDYSSYDYIIDCIDSVPSKILLIEMAKLNNVPVISAMGCGNKLDPSKLQVADISKTTVCPLAKMVRKLLREKNIKNVRVVFSTEEPTIKERQKSEQTNKQITGSIAYLPAMAGLLIASEIVKEFIK